MKSLEHMRAWFLGRSRREKVLAALFLCALGVTWLWSYLDRVQVGWRALGAVQLDVGIQETWLREKSDIEARYALEMTRLRESDRPTKNILQARLQELTNKHGLTGASIPAPTSSLRDPLTFYIYNISVSKADFFKLRAFHRELVETMPTVSLESITLTADRVTGQQITARFKLVAVEFNQ